MTRLATAPFAALALLAAAAFSLPVPIAGAQGTPAAIVANTAAPVPAPIEFAQDALANGLRVIYAPLKSAPVVHVRVHYHVGSRDERPDRQGFAHMFEHMMFRGSAHLADGQHGELVNGVGGISNAYTYFDETVYFQTLPAQHLEMVLYLEADRMASFKVNEEMYKTERKVVGEEWRLRQNRPYGTLYEDLLKTAFTRHAYQWTPIGNMQHLAAAGVGELQDFFNTYYLPNNAVMVIAGDFDVEETRQQVRKYFGWIPKGPAVKRLTPGEPSQGETRRTTVAYRVPLAMSALAFHTPEYSSDDHVALDLLATILGGGRSSRLDRALVHVADPQAAETSASNMQLQDSGMFLVDGTVLPGKDADAVEKGLLAAIAAVIEQGVTAEELEKAKTQARIGLIRGRQTAENLATQLGAEALFAGDPARVNTALAKLEAVTPAAVQAAARTYLAVDKGTVMRVKPDPLGQAARAAATQAAAVAAAVEAPVKPEPVTPRQVTFPADWPAKPPFNEQVVRAKFEKGTETAVDGVKVIVMPDSRLPLVNWSLTMRTGSHLDPAGKEGLASIVGDMLRRGAAGMTFDQLNEELEYRGVTVEVSAGGDTIRLGGSSLSKDLDFALQRGKQILLEPAFPADEFKKLKDQLVASLSVQQQTPGNVADDDLDAAVYGTSALGRSPTPKSVSAITLDDVKNWYGTFVHRKDAILVIAGDVTLDRGQGLAKQLLDGFKNAGEKDAVERAKLYEYPPIPAKRQIVLVDHPDAKGSVVRMAVRAYDVRSEDAYAGRLAGMILTSGVESRLNKYVRSERGLSYGVHGVFQPNRHGGVFAAGTDGAIETAAESAEAIFKVLEGMRAENVTPKELDEAQTRTIGLMLMSMQTVQQQATLRVDALLNGFPADYYDVYPEKISAVTADRLRAVVNQYVDPSKFTMVVVAPAEKVRAALEKVGAVRVVPMPAKRDGQDGPGQPDLLKQDGKKAG